MEVAGNSLVKHTEDKYQAKVVTFRCSCGLTNASIRSVGTHEQFCNEKHQRRHKCVKCLLKSDRVNGLQLIFHVSIPRSGIEQLKRKKKNYAWTDRELELLVETFIKLYKEIVRKV